MTKDVDVDIDVVMDGPDRALDDLAFCGRTLETIVVIGHGVVGV